MVSRGPYAYDVGLSFAGEQREYVLAVNAALKKLDVETFFDEDHQGDLWGKPSTEELSRAYVKDAHTVLMFISREYVEKPWPTHERRAVLAELTNREGTYLLPVRFDDTEVPGLDPSTTYLLQEKFTPQRLAEVVYQRLVKDGIKKAEPGPAQNAMRIKLSTSGQSAESVPKDVVKRVAGLWQEPVSTDPEDLMNALDFGTSRPVEVDSETLVTFEEFLPEVTDGADSVVLVMPSLPSAEGRSVRLRLQDHEGADVASYTARIDHAGRGRKGFCQEFDITAGLRVVARLPFREGDEGEITTHTYLTGLDAESTRRAATAMMAVHQASSAEVSMDGDLLVRIGNFVSNVDQEYMKQVRMLWEDADDLAVIQAETGSYFPMPGPLDRHERLWMRAVRLMLEGRAAPIPRRVFSAKALPDLNPEELLEEGSLLLPLSGSNFTIAGEPVPIPDFYVHHPHVFLEGLPEALADARAGLEDAREFTMHPADGGPFVAFMPERLNSGETMSTPWGLTGFEEPTKVQIRQGRKSVPAEEQ